MRKRVWRDQWVVEADHRMDGMCRISADGRALCNCERGVEWNLVKESFARCYKKDDARRRALDNTPIAARPLLKTIRACHENRTHIINVTSVGGANYRLRNIVTNETIPMEALGL